MRLLLIRHCEMAGDPYATPTRPVSGCLSSQGVLQAKSLQRALADEVIDLAICSAYGRAVQTAEIALKSRNVPFLIKDFLKEWLPSPDIREVTSTEYEKICKHNHSLHAEKMWKTELGEGVYDMYARIIPPFLRTMEELGVHARHGGYVFDAGVKDKTIAVFAHGGSLNILLSFLLQLPPFPVGAFRFELAGLAEIPFTEKAGVFYPSLTLFAPKAAAPVAILCSAKHQPATCSEAIPDHV